MKYRSGFARTFVVGMLITVLFGVVQPLPSARAADAQMAPGDGWLTLTLPSPETAELGRLAEVPELTDEPRTRLEELALRPSLSGLLTAPGPESDAASASDRSEQAQAMPSLGALVPDSFSFFQNSPLAPTTEPLEMASPSVANNGRDIMATYNAYTALSTDYGSSWFYVDPDELILPVHSGFAGNQDVLYDPSRDVMIWMTEYLADAGGNALRISSSRGAQQLEGLTWVSWVMESESFCGVSNPNSQFDRAQVVRTDNYVYVAANVFDNAGTTFLCTTLIRIPLNELAAQAGLTIGIFYSTAGDDYTPVQGGTHTLYFARHENLSQLRVYDWPESAAPVDVTSTLVNHTAYINTGYDCTITASTDPCAADDDRITSGWLRRDTNELGFMWDAAQDPAPLHTRAFPYVEVLTMNASTKAVVAETELWSADRAWLMASSGVNARGHVGGTIASAGGANMPGCHAWLHDDISNISSFSYSDVIVGTDAPAADHWGEYSRTRMNGRNPFQFIGACYAIESGTVTPRVVRFGRERDTHSRMKGDYNVDGRSEIAVFRPGTGVWYIRKQFNATWGGLAGDVPVIGDYDGDGRSDVAIWRPGGAAIFFIKGKFNSGWGTTGDVPVPADYNGDDKTDVAVWRPSTGLWYVKNIFNTIWGLPGDIPVPGDYNGDGNADLAVFRPSTGIWYVKGISNVSWGTAGDVPVPGDYNNDGLTDIAVFRPSTATWHVRGQFSTVWGTSTDIPVPGDYDADGRTDLAVFTPSTGTWTIKDQVSAVWGSSSDFPLLSRDTNGDGDPYQ